MSQIGQTSPTPDGAPSKEDTNMAVIIWVIGLFTGFIISLIFYLLKKDERGWLADAAREALNFQLSFLIYSFASLVLVFVIIGFIVLPVLGLLFVIFSIIGAVKCSSGQVYRCPLAIPMLR